MHEISVFVLIKEIHDLTQMDKQSNVLYLAGTTYQILNQSKSLKLLKIWAIPLLLYAYNVHIFAIYLKLCIFGKVGEN